MVIKLSIYVGLHDVYPVMEINFAFRRKVKMTATCNLICVFGRKKNELTISLKRQKKKEK